MQCFDYIIAGLRLRSTIDIVEMGIKGFKPFEHPYNSCIDAECSLLYDSTLTTLTHAALKAIYHTVFAQTNSTCTLYKCNNGYLLSLSRTRDNEREPILFHIALPQHTITTNAHDNDIESIAIVRFGLWVMFGIVLCSHQGIAIHSSAIVARERGVLFLGESGTGKSTHTRLWRENIEGSTLLNDDSPIVRIVDGKARVYGSPWSGKTPCYKSQDYPVAGFCRLYQAPYNKISRLPTIAAIGALLPSCPPAFAHDEILQDAICSTLDTVLRTTPAYSLGCLPDRDAALLSYSTIIDDAE